MKLDVSQAIRHPGNHYPFDAVQTMAPIENGSDVITLDDVQLQGVLTADEDGNITVDGSLSTTAHGLCARCLGEASYPIDVPFRETFVYNGDPEDDESFCYTSSRIDFEKLVLTCVLTVLPMRLLCSENCTGFGGYTTVDNVMHNEEDEEPARQDNPFAVLQQLLTDDEAGNGET